MGLARVYLCRQTMSKPAFRVPLATLSTVELWEISNDSADQKLEGN
jgi:hypothetical protein